MTRGLFQALCRLLALLACVMCSQPASRAQARAEVQVERVADATGAAFHAGRGAVWVSDPGLPAEREPDGVPGSEPSREERESDDDPDQDDDFDDAQPLDLRSTLWGTQPLLAGFGASLVHDPVCSNHRLLDPRPPRRL